jgi:hypothetical protein
MDIRIDMYTHTHTHTRGRGKSSRFYLELSSQAKYVCFCPLPFTYPTFPLALPLCFLHVACLLLASDSAFFCQLFHFLSRLISLVYLFIFSLRVSAHMWVFFNYFLLNDFCLFILVSFLKVLKVHTLKKYPPMKSVHINFTFLLLCAYILEPRG